MLLAENKGSIPKQGLEAAPERKPKHWRGSRVLSDAVLWAQLNSAATLRKVLALAP